MESILLEEDYRPALAPKHARIFAYCLDFFILWTLLYFGWGSLLSLSEGTVRVGFTFNGIGAIGLPITWFLVFVLPESLKGQTIGKMAFRVRVLSDDYKHASFGQFSIRHLTDVVDWLPLFGIAGIVVASSNKSKKRLGDLVARTIVVDGNMK